MGTKYTTNTISGYNSTPPADDGSQTESNRTKWSTVKTKLSDPIKALAEAINTALVNAFDYASNNQAVNYTTVAGDHDKTIEVTAAATITLLAAASGGSGYRVIVSNQHSAAITVQRGGSDVINGSITSYSVQPGAAVQFIVNAAGNGYLANVYLPSKDGITVPAALTWSGAQTFSGGVTLSGTASNITTGSNYISNGGTDAGLSFDGSNNATFSGTLAVGGNATIGNTSTNYLTVNGNSTGQPSYITAAGGDTNIGIDLNAKGTGAIRLNSNSAVQLSVSSSAFTVTPNATFSGTLAAGATTITGASAAAGIIYIKDDASRQLKLESPSAGNGGVAYVGTTTNHPVYLQAGGVTALTLQEITGAATFTGTLAAGATTITGACLPGAHNTYDLGSTGTRWKDVWCQTGAFNGSDARLKTPLQPLTANELNAAKQLAAEQGTYKWLESIEKKGDAARKHIGMTVQRAIEIMQANSLDPFAYGFIGYDEWPEKTIEHPAIEAVEAKDAEFGEYETVDEPYTIIVDGEEVQATRKVLREIKAPVPAVEAREGMAAWTEVVQQAGNTYSFRHDQLLLFMARGFHERLAALEAQ